MGRAKRADDGGIVFHVLNRANARATILEAPEAYVAFERVLGEALERVDMRVLAYCLTALPFRTFAFVENDSWPFGPFVPSETRSCDWVAGFARATASARSLSASCRPIRPS